MPKRLPTTSPIPDTVSERYFLKCTVDRVIKAELIRIRISKLIIAKMTDYNIFLVCLHLILIMPLGALSKSHFIVALGSRF